MAHRAGFGAVRCEHSMHKASLICLSRASSSRYPRQLEFKNTSKPLLYLHPSSFALLPLRPSHTTAPGNSRRDYTSLSSSSQCVIYSLESRRRRRRSRATPGIHSRACCVQACVDLCTVYKEASVPERGSARFSSRARWRPASSRPAAAASTCSPSPTSSREVRWRLQRKEDPGADLEQRAGRQ